MILTLARDNSGRCVGLQLPAEPADIAAAYEKLDAVSTNDRQTRILRADTGVGSLDFWLRDRKMDRPGDYIELGELAEKIGQMDEQQRKTFDGALAGAAFGSVADVLRIADSLGEYKIMSVELSGNGDSYAAVTLPLTPYEMLDTLDKLRMTPEEEPDWEICGFLAHRELHDWIGSGSVYELNALCQKLSELNPQESTVFEGLVEMEKEKDAKIIPMHRLLDLAYSTSQCHLLDEVHNEEQLGRFAAENGFVPEADDLSDKAFELLDFKKIGERFMRGEGGVIVRGGYVAQDGDLAQDVWKSLDLTPRKPDYAILVELIAPDPNDNVKLVLPAPPAELDAAMALTGAHELSEAPCLCLDCRAPALRDAITDANSLADACRAADQLAALSESQLKIFRALITAMEVTELGAALDFAERIDEYLLSPEMRTFEETAEYDLRFCLGDEAAEVLLPHVNLYQYGRALQEREQFALTDYGRVQRVDCQPLMAENQKEQPTMGGMEMTQG